MPTIATVPCGDMVARYEQDQVTGDVRFMLLPVADGLVGPRPTRVARPRRGAEQVKQAKQAKKRRWNPALWPNRVLLTNHSYSSLWSAISLVASVPKAGPCVTVPRPGSCNWPATGWPKPGGTVAATLDLVAEGRLAVSHHLRWQDGAEAVEVDVTITNISDDPFTLQLLASFCLAGIGGPVLRDPPGRFLVHRIRTGWSSEARLVSEAFEDLHMERAWTDHAVNVERFGQVGSMPVRGFAPCAGIEDTVAGLTWAAQLAWAGSWQMELFGKGGKVSLSGGLADWDFGHWRKVLAPGESFTTPRAWLTVAAADFDTCSQRLVGMQELSGDRQDRLSRLADLAPVANEWCTTWGRPSHDEVVAMADRVSGSDIKYFVIDAGWYESASGRWIDAHGDWVVDRAEFPDGLAATAKAVRERGSCARSVGRVGNVRVRVVGFLADRPPAAPGRSADHGRRPAILGLPGPVRHRLPIPNSGPPARGVRDGLHEDRLQRNPRGGLRRGGVSRRRTAPASGGRI